MADGRDCREDMQRIAGLVQEMESIADPAVRNFVGLSEYAWDFNAPTGVPGVEAVPPQRSDY